MRGPRPVAPKNGYDTKIAVLSEQMLSIGKMLTQDREDTKGFREDVRKDARRLGLGQPVADGLGGRLELLGERFARQTNSTVMAR